VAELFRREVDADRPGDVPTGEADGRLPAAAAEFHHVGPSSGGRRESRSPSGTPGP
jgi:hypothetical protein